MSAARRSPTAWPRPTRPRPICRPPSGASKQELKKARESASEVRAGPRSRPRQLVEEARAEAARIVVAAKKAAEEEAALAAQRAKEQLTRPRRAAGGRRRRAHPAPRDRCQPPRRPALQPEERTALGPPWPNRSTIARPYADAAFKLAVETTGSAALVRRAVAPARGDRRSGEASGVITNPRLSADQHRRR